MATLKKIKNNLEERKKSLELQFITGSKAEQKAAVMFLIILLKTKKGEEKLESNMYQFFTNIHNIGLKRALLKNLLIVEFEAAKKIFDYEQLLNATFQIKMQLQEEVGLRKMTFIQNMYWNNLLLGATQSTLQYKLFRQLVKREINCPSIYENWIFYFHDSMDQMKQNWNLFQKLSLEVAYACFQLDKFEIFFTEILFILKNLLDNQFRTETIEIVFRLAEQYLAYLEKQLSWNGIQYSLEGKDELQNSSFDTHTSKFESKQAKLNSCQGYFYFFLLFIGKSAQKYVVRYEQIVKNSYWKALQRYLLTNYFSHKQTNYTAIYFYNMLRYKNNFKNHHIEFIRLAKTELRLLNQQTPIFAIKSLLFHLIQSKKQYQKYTPQDNQQLVACNKLITTVIIWAWNYHKVNNNIKAYFFDTHPNPTMTFQTLQYLWIHRKEEKNKIYEFLKDLIQILGQQSSDLFVSCFIQTIQKFYESYWHFFNYQILKKNLGEINWMRRYQLYCYALALTLQFNQHKDKIRLDILKYVDTLLPGCKNRVLYFHFQTLLKSNLKIWKKRKITFQLKYLMMKVNVDIKKYHKYKVQVFLRFIGFHKRKKDWIKERLRRKLLRVE